MGVKRSSHALYDCKYHFVWAPKYRKWILRGDIRKDVESLFHEIAENFEFEIETLEVSEDHVHIFLGFPPRYSIAKVVGILKSISASEIFEKHPEVKKELWGGEFWEDGYFARTVGDHVTQEMVRKYIEAHKSKKLDAIQLDLFSS
jgi:putative transposase